MENGAVKCRSCDALLGDPVVDLGRSPLCESYVLPERLDAVEPTYPLALHFCETCFLVQMHHDASPELIFGDYVYSASYSDPGLEDAKTYCKAVVERLGLDERSFVLEIGSNDGYLLRNFVSRRIPCLGVDPAVHPAGRARERGVETVIAFFDEVTALKLRRERLRDTWPNLIIAHIVPALVPELNSFIAGIRLLLAPTGTATFEFPHLMSLVEGNQFDTIYHEHFSYFSLLAFEKLLARHALVVYDVEELPRHGGSLRVFARHASAVADSPPTPAVADLRRREETQGYTRVDSMRRFMERVAIVKDQLATMLRDIRRSGHSIAGYGAPGKATTLLSYCEIGVETVSFTVDRNPHKQGKYLPGSRIPIYPPARLDAVKPQYVLLFPWNLEGEILEQLSHLRSNDTRCIIPVPQPKIV